MRRRVTIESQIPEKANRILGGIMVFLLLIVARIWHLAVIQHEDKIEEANRPQRRTVVEKPERATILDRSGVPLAVNRIQYHAAVCYTPIREVRRVQTVVENGKKVKKYLRKEYIQALSEKLGSILYLNPIEIEDAIYAKAAILGNVPFRLKEDISEECYFKLKSLEQNWPGIVAEVAPKRVYPQGATCGEILGYIGSISSTEYQRVLERMQKLREEDNITELEEVQRQACSLNDLTGKMGVEASFDRILRGEKGKKIFLADTRGNFLRPLPGSVEPQEGVALRLTLDCELQAECERLLEEYELESPSMRPADQKRSELIPPLQPWIKGGAIVVMDPKTGDILAMATHPSFDPNAFSEKSPLVNSILETEAALAEMWEFRQPLRSIKQQIDLTWENYLQLILPRNSAVVLQLQKWGNVQDALFVQEKLERLFSLFDADKRKVLDVLYDAHPTGVEFTIPERDYFAARLPEVQSKVAILKEALAPYLDPLVSNSEKLLFADLYRLLIDPKRFVKPVDLSLSDYRLVSGHFFSVEAALRQIVYDLFEQTLFQEWRKKHFKGYLASMRKQEKVQKQKYAKPYTDYLEQKKRELFGEIWDKHRGGFLSLFLTGKGAAPFQRELAAWARELRAGAYPALPWRASYLHVSRFAHLLEIFPSFRSYEDLDEPLWGRYSALRSQTLKHLAAAFYPRYGYGIARSWAYRQATVIGSIFKLIPAYEAMRQKYLRNLEEGKSVADVNPLTIIDDKHRVYGKGWNVGFTLDGRAIPLFYKGGRLPRSEHSHVGRVEVERALETSSNPYFSMLAGDLMEDPEDLVRAANLFSYGEKTEVSLPGEYAGILPRDVVYDRTGLYSMAIGQHSMVGTPLQTAVMLGAIANGGKVMRPRIALHEEPQVRWELFMPKEIQRKLINGMKRVVMGENGTARFVKSSFPSDLCNRFVGKTSTAEVIECYGLDPQYGRMKAKEIWFGGILYHDKECTDPDKVIVVYLKQGVFGRLAAPYAFNVAKKWEELNNN